MKATTPVGHPLGWLSIITCTILAASACIIGDDAGTDPSEASKYPLRLQGKSKKEATVTLDVSKPQGAIEATLDLEIFDADFPDEGELYIQGNGPIPLFGESGRSANDGRTTQVTLNTPAKWWSNGANALRFVHTKTFGFRIQRPPRVEFRVKGPATTSPELQSSLPPPDEWTDVGVALRPSRSGWDSYNRNGFGVTAVVQHDGVYYMYYTGSSGPRSNTDDGPANRAIGVATSRDGVTFTKYSGNPILTHQSDDHPNRKEEGASTPVVARSPDGTWVMFWAAKTASGPEDIANDIHMATSYNGHDFTDHGVQIKNSGKPGRDEVLPNGVLYVPGRSRPWMLWYSSDESGQRRTLLQDGTSPFDLALVRRKPVLSMRSNSPFLHSDNTISILTAEGKWPNMVVKHRLTTTEQPTEHTEPTVYFTSTKNKKDFGGRLLLDRKAGLWRWYYTMATVDGKGELELAVRLRTAPM